MQTTSPNIRAVAGRPEQAHSDNTSSRSPLATALALAAMSLGLGVVQLDITIVNTALSSIGASLGGSVAELQWVVTAYTIAFAAFILTAGALGDRLGAKRIFMAGFAIFTLASLACALAPSAVFLIVARSVQGLAAAILVPNSLTLLNHAYADPKERGRAVGFWAAGAAGAIRSSSWASRRRPWSDSCSCGTRRARHNRCSRSRCLPIACSRSPRWSGFSSTSPSTA